MAGIADAISRRRSVVRSPCEAVSGLVLVDIALRNPQIDSVTVFDVNSEWVMKPQEFLTHNEDSEHSPEQLMVGGQFQPFPPDRKVEWSRVVSVKSNMSNSRRHRLSAQRQAIARFEDWPSK